MIKDDEVEVQIDVVLDSAIYCNVKKDWWKSLSDQQKLDVSNELSDVVNLYLQNNLTDIIPHEKLDNIGDISLSSMLRNPRMTLNDMGAINIYDPNEDSLKP